MPNSSKKLRVVHIGFSNIRYMIQLVNSLPTSNLEILVIIPKKYSYYLKALKKNIDFFLYDWEKNHLNPRNLLSNIQILKRIREFNPSIVHTQNGGNSFFFLMYPFLRKSKIFCTVHDPILHSGEKKLAVRYLNKFSYSQRYNKKYFVNGLKMKKFLALNRKINPNKIVPIQRGDYSIYLNWDHNEVRAEKNTILFFGRIRDYKGLNYLINAEPLITKEIPDIKIIIAGKGAGDKRYLDSITNMERFEIHDYWIPIEEMVKFYKRACIIVMPYTDASQSGVAPLALSCIRPVIVTNVGSVPELVDHNRTGLVIPPRNVKSLARAVIDLLKNPSKLDKMKSHISEKLKTEDMQWITASKQTIDAYLEDSNFEK